MPASGRFAPSPMLPSHLIGTFVQIADAGSLNAAANTLGVSRSVVSERLASLEADLGTLLMTRSTQGLSLTASGEIFLERARDLLSAMASARDAVAEADGALAGRLRVTSSSSLAQDWLAPVFARFLEAHPGVSLEVSISDRTTDMIEGGFDLAIRGGRLPDSDLLGRRLGTLRRTLVCSPDYAENNGVPMSLAEISNHATIVYRNLRITEDFTFVTGNGIRSHRLNSRFETDNGNFMAKAAVEGIGIALLPNFIVARDLIAGRLVPIDVGVQPEYGTLAAIYPRAHRSMPRLTAFVEHAHEMLGEPAPWDRALAS